MILCFKTGCSKQFDDCESYKCHLKIKHLMKDVGEFVCSHPGCSSQFSRMFNLMRHLQLQHKYQESSQSIENLRNVKVNKNSDGSLEKAVTLEPTIQENEEERDLVSVLSENFLNFLVRLHTDGNMTKKLTVEIFNDVKKTIIDPILTYTNTNDIKRKKIEESYQSINTLYKFEKKLRDKNLHMKSKKIVVHNRVGTELIHGRPIIKEISESVTLLPVDFQIKCFFELPNVLSEVLQQMKIFEDSADDSICHFVQGKLWQDIKASYQPNDIVIPVILYSDDFSPDNVLSGSTLHKQCTFQYTFPVLPQHLLSSTEYVFEALLFPSRIKTLQQGLDNALVDLINIFKKLETEGIDLTINESTVKVYFVVSLKVGDNLDLNEMLGFQKSFNANSFCRLCRTKSDSTKKDSSVRQENLRNEMNFLEDLEKNDPKSTGVCFNSIFNNLRSFHVTKNFYCDMMHDLYEGICKYVIAQLLNHYIFKKKKFSLKTFNNLKNQFDYGEIEVNNASQEIQENHIKNSNINLTSSEMKCLVQFLPMMIGSYIEEDDEDYEHWLLFLEMQEIIDDLLKSKHTRSSLDSLRTLIKKFLDRYIKIFGHLRPKFHFLTHYPDCIEQVGPLRNMMCFVFEQKNRQIKSYSKVMNQRVNLSVSLSFKSSMRFTKFLQNHASYGFKSEIKIDRSKVLAWADISSKSYYPNVTSYFENLSGKEEILEITRMTFKNSVYKRSFFVLQENCNNEIQLYQIADIISIDSMCILIVEVYHVERFSTHLRCYEAGSSSGNFKVIPVAAIEHLPLNLHAAVDGKKYFSIKNI